MAKNGFKVFDSDMHIMEPPDLWERYISPEFRLQAPRGRTSENVRDLGLIFPNAYPAALRTRGTPHKGHNYDKNQGIYRDHAARGWTGEVQLEAMDTEGIDVAVLFLLADWACLPIRTTSHGLPRLWHAHTTTGFTTFARPTPLDCLAPV
jgi:uncharacterized protein